MEESNLIEVRKRKDKKKGCQCDNPRKQTIGYKKIRRKTMSFHTNYNGIKRPAGMCGEEYDIWRKKEEKRLEDVENEKKEVGREECRKILADGQWHHESEFNHKNDPFFVEITSELDLWDSEEKEDLEKFGKVSEKYGFCYRLKKVEEPKVEEPKVEEPKVEEPKIEEPKVEEPKVEEPKVEEPKVEKNVMKRAWEISYQAAKKFGGSKKEYFSLAMKEAWLEQKKMKNFQKVFQNWERLEEKEKKDLEMEGWKKENRKAFMRAFRGIGKKISLEIIDETHRYYTNS